MSEIPKVFFNRKPYTVTYMKDGERQTIRRRPPPVLHDMLPTDKVELKFKKNDDFNRGDYTIKHINPRHPNTIQIMGDDGKATFVDYRDIELQERVGTRAGVLPEDLPENNRYLNWP